MCAGPLCLGGNWTPSISPLFIPPRGGGWIISTLPDAFSQDPEWDRLVWGWNYRRKLAPSSPSESVNEMIRFLEMNDIKIGKEERKLIREHADREWCSRDPKRCPKKKPAHDVYATHMLARGAALQNTQSAGRSCCGGGAVR